MLPLFLASALASPGTDVLLVVSPGFAPEAFAPFAEALASEGHRVHPVGFPCAGHDLDDLVRLHVAQAQKLDGPVVVCHGIGCVIALSAASRLEATKYVLLAPVLAVGPTRSFDWLAGRPLPAHVSLEGSLTWQDHDLRTVLLGQPIPRLSCVPRPFAEQVQGWLRGQALPLDLVGVKAPVWVGVSLGDQVAAVEAVVPASRSFPNRELVRFGINRMDPQDFSHGELLAHSIPLRAAARAVSTGDATHE